MSKITTEDCKEFLVDHFQKLNVTTLDKDWKRVKKHKDENGLWLRDFSHPILGNQTVIEDKNGGLSLFGQVQKASTQLNNTTVDTTVANEYVQRVFSSKEVKEAKKLIDAHLDDPENFDELIETDNWKSYYHALPSNFAFSFPKDEYGNEIENITNGLDSPMEFDGSMNNCFSVIFTNKDGSDTDEYANDVFRQDTFPDWVDFMDETHVGIQYKSGPKDLTVKDFVKYLFSLGFSYNSTDCLFAKYLSKIKPQKDYSVVECGLENATKDIDIVDVPLENLAVEKKTLIDIKAVFIKDDVQKLQEYIKDGNSVNDNLPNHDKLILFAAKKNAFKCFDFLSQNGASLWIENENKEPHKTVGSELLCVFHDENNTYYEKSLSLIYKEDFKKYPDYVEKVSDFLKTFDCIVKDDNELIKLLSHIKSNSVGHEDDFYKIIIKNSHLLLKIKQETEIINAINYIQDSTIIKNEVVNSLDVSSWSTALFLLQQLDNKGIDTSTITINQQPIKEYVSNYHNKYIEQLDEETSGKRLIMVFQGAGYQYSSIDKIEENINKISLIYNYLNKNNTVKPKF